MVSVISVRNKKVINEQLYGQFTGINVRIIIRERFAFRTHKCHTLQKTIE